MRDRVIAALAALLVGAASVAHGFQESPAQSAAMDLEHWRRLGDTTLIRLIDEALVANLDLQVAEARVRSARGAKSGATWELLPQGQVSGSFTRRRFAGGSFPGVSGRLPDESLWDVGAEAAWELDVFGRLRSGVRAQGALVEASEADRRAVQVAIAAEVARAYFDLRGAQEQLEVARRNSANQQRTLALTRERLDAGRGTAFDTERATAQLAATRASIPLVEAMAAAATYRIGVLLGQTPTALAAELATIEALPAFPDSIEVADTQAIVAMRPDVLAAERFAAAQSAFVGAAKAEYLPRLRIGAAVGLLAPDPSGLGDEGSFRYAVGPVVTWPLLSFGRIHATVSQARAAEDAARVEQRQAVLAALEDVQNALTRYRAARSRAVELTASSGASRNAAELARMRYAEGIADFLQVLDAERTQLESERLLALGRTDVATAYAGLYKAFGGR
ncbi:MAG TPA: TolC family protein [Gemmatimonadales bacterium]|nr:TolC family protein [Gemmatimonadales bacterium]